MTFQFVDCGSVAFWKIIQRQCQIYFWGIYYPNSLAKSLGEISRRNFLFGKPVRLPEKPSLVTRPLFFLQTCLGQDYVNGLQVNYKSFKLREIPQSRWTPTGFFKRKLWWEIILTGEIKTPSVWITYSQVLRGGSLWPQCGYSSKVFFAVQEKAPKMTLRDSKHFKSFLTHQGFLLLRKYHFIASVLAIRWRVINRELVNCLFITPAQFSYWSVATVVADPYLTSH